jgi:hypothetical protein
MDWNPGIQGITIIKSSQALFYGAFASILHCAVAGDHRDLFLSTSQHASQPAHVSVNISGEPTHTVNRITPVMWLKQNAVMCTSLTHIDIPVKIRLNVCDGDR